MTDQRAVVLGAGPVGLALIDQLRTNGVASAGQQSHVASTYDRTAAVHQVGADVVAWAYETLRDALVDKNGPFDG